ncbi:MAG: high-potential iron-sulfur protein [Bacteroidetes Order II. Incertae sedis bacterium]|nr:high-potential iron-sulfur protein [Bacteroidetes Order II. bacterium]
MQEKLNRRDFLFKAAMVGAVAPALAGTLAACGGGGDTAAAGCNDTTGLAPADITMRQTLKYVDVTTDPTKACDGCQLYIAATGGAACGKCSVVKGPIAPKGYCTSWVKKA